MRILEHEAKSLLAAQGLSIPHGRVVTEAKEAAAAAAQIGAPVLVKAQIPSGGRMKTGGVRIANNPAEAGTVAAEILGKELFDFEVRSVLVEEKIAAVSEIFIGVTYNSHNREATIIASAAGGIDVEAGAPTGQRPFSLGLPIPNYLGREVALQLGYENREFLRLSRVISRLMNCFYDWDALLLEVNPLILDGNGQWWVADVHLEVDDDAIFRQKKLLEQLPVSVRQTVHRSDFERRAEEIDNADHRGVAGRLVPFGGDLGLLIGGGGASLTIMDAILDAGLNPANYCEIGGNPSVWKIKELTKLILEQNGVDKLAVIMNVVSNTRVDLVARGVIKGILELGREPRNIIVAFRIPGSWEDEGIAILRHYDIPFFGRETSIDEVVDSIRWLS